MYAVLHIADFALHAVLRTESGAGDRPAALFSGVGKKSLVLAANPSARASGVELGMSAPQAVARCAALIIRAPQPDADAEARATLLAVGFTLSPSIEETAPGVCTIDLKGADPAQHRRVAAAAVDELTHLGLPATAGIAATPLLALYAARAIRPRARDLNRARDRDPALDCTPLDRSRSPNRSRSPSEKVPAQSAAPTAITSTSTIKITSTETNAHETDAVLLVVDPAHFLTPLPLSVADPSPELAAVLANWGLRTLGDLTALPRDEIVRRFGTEGLALWNRAAGGAPRPLRTVTPAQTFAAAMEFEEEIETLEPLLFILRRFLDRLTLELIASQHVAVELDLTLRLEDDTQHARSFRLPEPTADVEILFRTLHTHLESLQTAASIGAVRLRLTPARPLVRQQGLFETGLRDPHGFAETLARVSALVGSERVGTPQLHDTHRPDVVTLSPPAAVIAPPAEPTVHPPLGLPLRRFRPPLPARVEFTDGRLTYVWTDLVRGEICTESGDWPSSGEWWQRDRTWARREWDIALTDGGLYRLLLLGDAYFIEGEYD